jgi:hypothetical protein
MAYHTTEDTPHMNKYINTFEDLLTQEDWSYQKHDGDNRVYLSSSYSGQNASVTLVLDANLKKDWVMSFVYLPSKIQQAFRPAIAELLCRINLSEIGLGHFDLDFDDGEIRFRIIFDLEGSHFSIEMARNMRDQALLTVDKFYPAIMAVLYGDKTAQEAIDKSLELHQKYLQDTKTPTPEADNDTALSLH